MQFTHYCKRLIQMFVNFCCSVAYLLAYICHPHSEGAMFSIVFVCSGVFRNLNVGRVPGAGTFQVYIIQRLKICTIFFKPPPPKYVPVYLYVCLSVSQGDNF